MGPTTPFSKPNVATSQFEFETPVLINQKGKYFNGCAVVIWYDQERRLSLNNVDRDLLMDNRVQLDTTHKDLPGWNSTNTLDNGIQLSEIIIRVGTSSDQHWERSPHVGPSAQQQAQRHPAP